MTFRHRDRDAAHHARDRSLEVSNARFARVVDDDRVERLFPDAQELFRHPVLFVHARDEVARRDVTLLLVRVAGAEYLHAVLERGRNRIELVRRRDEQHLREVERHRDSGPRT